MNKKFFMISLLVANVAVMKAEELLVTVNPVEVNEKVEVPLSEELEQAQAIEIKTRHGHDTIKVVHAPYASHHDEINRLLPEAHHQEIVNRFSPAQLEAFLDFAKTLESLLNDTQFLTFIAQVLSADNRTVNDQAPTYNFEELISTLRAMDSEVAKAKSAHEALQNLTQNENFKNCINAYNTCVRNGVDGALFPEIVSLMTNKNEARFNHRPHAAVIVTHKTK